MSPTASHTGRRADDRRGAEPRRGSEVKRSAPEYERELRRQELAIGRSLTSVLPTDRPARVRELVEARRVMSNAVRDLQRVARDLEADLERYRAHRSHTQREALAYEAVAGEIEEVLLRWEARREQLSATIERANPRQSRVQGKAPAGRGDRTAGGRGDRGGRASGDRGSRATGERGAGRDRATGDQGRPDGNRASAGGRQSGGRQQPGPRQQPGGRQSGGPPSGDKRGGPAGRSGGRGGRAEPPRGAGAQRRPPAQPGSPR